MRLLISSRLAPFLFRHMSIFRTHLFRLLQEPLRSAVEKLLLYVSFMERIHFPKSPLLATSSDANLERFEDICVVNRTKRGCRKGNKSRILIVSLRRRVWFRNGNCFHLKWYHYHDSDDGSGAHRHFSLCRSQWCTIRRCNCFHDLLECFQGKSRSWICFSSDQ